MSHCQTTHSRLITTHFTGATKTRHLRSTGPEILLPTHLESHLAARPNLEDESLVHPGHILRYVGLLARQAQPRSSHPANVSFSVFKIAASHANAQHGTRSTAFVPPFRGRDHALDTQVSGRGQ